MAKHGDDATGTVLASLVAAAVLLASIGAVLWATGHKTADSDPVDEAARRSEAESLAQILVSSEGQGWSLGADSVMRLGLANENGSGIDLDKMDAMRGAAFLADPLNNVLDYDEAMLGLGTKTEREGDVETQFHIRIYPVGLKKVLASSDLSHIHTLYIGDWQSLLSVTVAFQLDQEQMVEDARTGLDAQMALGVMNERDMLRGLGLGFDDEVHIGASQPTVYVDILGIKTHISTHVDATLLAGDVYPDHKQYLDAVLAGRIDDYDLVVIGSGVDQSSLTSAVTKQAIADWVLAGGDLMVFGSGTQDFQWLQPLFSLGTSTANGQAFAPDINHPMLQEPHRLNWPAYDNQGVTWNLKDQGSNAHYEDFEHIISAAGDRKHEDVLTVSTDGSFGEGRVFLTGFQPDLIAESLGLAEAANFVHNMVTYADRDYLYLDYGPTVPQDTTVASAIRHSHVWDAQLGQVPVRVEILVWKA